MPKKKHNSTPLQKEYQRELKNLKRRAKSWQKTHRMLYTDIPETPKRVTKQSIERLRNIKYNSFSEEQKQYYRNEYEEAYEERNLPIPEEDIPPYSPPTEDDYYNDYFNDDQYWWEDTPNEPVQSTEEFDAWIDDLIDTILDTSAIARPNLEVRQTLQNLLNNARTQLGDKQFFEFLSDGDRVTRLQQLAYEGMSTSPTKNGTNGRADDAIFKFATELNMGRPLTDEEAYNLQAYGTTNFDYSDLEE